MVITHQTERFWTGVGTRRPLSERISRLQSTIGRELAEKGLKLLTGGAIGSDYNFLHGVCGVNQTLAQVWRPLIPDQPMSRGTLPYGKPHIEVIHIEEADFQVARAYFIKHDIVSDFDKMETVTQWLHARNYYQIFSKFEVAVSEFVVYDAAEDRWGNVGGGTRTTVKIARVENVPTFNLRLPPQKKAFLEMVKGL